MQTLPPRALILDFDGLMLDTETAVLRGLEREFYEKEGQHLAVADWLGAVGYVNGFDPRAHLEKLTGRAFRLARSRFGAARNARANSSRRCRLFPGVRTLLESGARLGYRIGVASNSSGGLGACPGWSGSGCGIGSPSCGPARRSRTTSPRRTCTSPRWRTWGSPCRRSGAFAFEDSEPGVRAAKAAGLYVVAVPNDLTRDQDLSLADEIRDTLEGYELPVVPR